MSKMIKETMILFVITLIAGMGLGYVYDITLKPRQEQELKVKNQAYKTVFSEADSFGEAIHFNQDELNKYIAKRDKEVKLNDSNNKNNDIDAQIDEVIPALSAEGNVLGYVITVTDNEAYSGKVRFSVGIKNDGTVNGISFLSINETPGLGMKASEDSFISRFKDKDVDYFRYTKTGEKQREVIDSLSGATITTNAVTNGATAAIYCFHYITGGEGNE